MDTATHPPIQVTRMAAVRTDHTEPMGHMELIPTLIKLVETTLVPMEESTEEVTQHTMTAPTTEFLATAGTSLVLMVTSLSQSESSQAEALMQRLMDRLTSPQSHQNQ